MLLLIVTESSPKRHNTIWHEKLVFFFFSFIFIQHPTQPDADNAVMTASSATIIATVASWQCLSLYSIKRMILQRHLQIAVCF